MADQTGATIRELVARRGPALLLSVGLGLALAVLLLTGMRPAAAAGPAEPAAVYACSEAGLDNALAAGGSATFSCAVPTTVTVSARKTVAHNVSLDGGNRLILSGGNATAVFTVGAGIHLSLLNLVVRDALGGAVYNGGFLNASQVRLISNTAAIGAALYNAAGATANFSNVTVTLNASKAGVVWNGDVSVPTSATLSVANSNFNNNRSAEGSAIYNANGWVTVTSSSFSSNFASLGGAIFNATHLNIQGSEFEFNFAGTFPIDSLADLSALTNLPKTPVGPSQGGGAIYIGLQGDATIQGTDFTSNAADGAGGAVFYGTLPLDSSVLANVHSLLIDSSTFNDNCVGGAGGALASSERTIVTHSIFQFNFADSGSNPCVSWAASRASGATLPGGGALAPVVGLPSELEGSGGAIFSDYNLSVDGSSFLTNTATVTTTGGGGAISNHSEGLALVSNSLFADNRAMQDGGAVFNSTLADFTAAADQFRTNTAQNDSGGAIANEGALTVTQSSFIANGGAPAGGTLHGGGGAIFSGLPPGPFGPSGPAGQHGSRASPQVPQGPGVNVFLRVDHSTFSSNTSIYEGGALDFGPGTVSASSFTSNTARYGGAIDVWRGPITLTADSFIANAVVTTISGPEQGGAIDGNDSQTAIVNSTFYQNRAEGSATGGAINLDLGTMQITNSTFLSNSVAVANRGGAFWSFAGNAITLTDSLVAFNAGGNCNTALHLVGPNLEFPGVTCGGASVQADPRALAPADNGGPTLTSALLFGSPAIDVGDNTTCASTDQRGAHRPVGPQCDLGAFEFGGLVPRLWLPLVRK